MTTHDPLTGIDPTHPLAIGALTDANGDAFVYLCVSTTPGDNYRVVASLDHDLLSADGVLSPGPRNWSPAGASDVDRIAAMAKVAYKMTPTMVDPVALPTTAVGRQASFAMASVDLMVRRVFQIAFQRTASVDASNQNSSSISKDQAGFGSRRTLAEFYPVQTADGQQVIKMVFSPVPVTNNTGDNKLPQYWKVDQAPLSNEPEERDPSLIYADTLVANQSGTPVPSIPGRLDQLSGRGGWQDGRMHVIDATQLQVAAFHILGNGETTAIAESSDQVTTTVSLAIPALAIGGSATSMRKVAGRLVLGGVSPTPSASWVGLDLVVGTTTYAITATAPTQGEVTVNASAANLPIYLVDHCWQFMQSVGITHLGGQLPPWSIDKVVTVNGQSGPFLDRMFRNLPMAVHQLPEQPTGVTEPFVAHLSDIETWSTWHELLSLTTGYAIYNRPRLWGATVYSGYDGTMSGDGSPASEERDYGYFVTPVGEGWPQGTSYFGIDVAPAEEWMSLSQQQRLTFLMPWTQYGYGAPDSIKDYELRLLRRVAQFINSELVVQSDGDVLPQAPIGGYDTTNILGIPGIMCATNRTDPGLVDTRPVQKGSFLFPTDTVQGVTVPLQETGFSPYSIWYVRHHLRSPGVSR